MGAMDLQHIQYRELRKGLQVWACGYERHKGFERFLQRAAKAMNMKVEWTEMETQGLAYLLQTSRENSDYEHKPGD